MNMDPQMNPPPSYVKFENVWNWPNTRNANLFISPEKVIANFKPFFFLKYSQFLIFSPNFRGL